MWVAAQHKEVNKHHYQGARQRSDGNINNNLNTLYPYNAVSMLGEGQIRWPRFEPAMCPESAVLAESGVACAVKQMPSQNDISSVIITARCAGRIGWGPWCSG